MISRKAQDKKKIEQKIRAAELQLFHELFGEKPLTEEPFLKLNTAENTGEPEIFLFPGREGCGCIFSHLAKYLKVPAVSLQYDNKHPEKNLSIEQITSNIYPHFLERHKSRRNFFIVAYSFGALVAIELIRRLESEGFVGQFIIIDSSPLFLDLFIKERITGTTEDDIETSWLEHVSQLFAPRLAPTLPAAVKDCTSWDEKVDIFFKYAPPDMCGLKQVELRTLFNVMYHRTRGAESSRATFSPIDTPILLLKATQKTLKTPIDEDYGLSKITRGKVNVYDIEATHVTILTNPEVASIINAEWELFYAEPF